MDALGDFFIGWFLIVGTWAIAWSFISQYRVSKGDYGAEMEIEGVQQELRRDAETSVKPWQFGKRREVKIAIAELLTGEEQERVQRYAWGATAWGYAAGGSFLVALATTGQVLRDWFE
jgi:hypothetical protein